MQPTRRMERASFEDYARDGITRVASGAPVRGMRSARRQLVYVEEVLVPNLPDAGGVLHEARQDIGGFKTFILRGNVVDLAIGVVIGAALAM